jgi:hypothetical protein
MDNEQTVDDVASMGEDDPSTLLSDYLKHGAYSPIGEVQEYAEGGEVTGDPLFGTFPVRQAAANAYSNPIINQPAVGPTPVGQQPVSIPTALSTPPLPTALSTMQQPQATPTTPGFAPVTTGAATTLSASDMLSNIPTFASTARALPTMNIAQTPTLEKPVLREEKDLPKPVINLAPPDILQKYGGTPISFERPADVAGYLTPDNLPKVTTTGTTTGTGGYTAPAEMRTPGGYTYTNYQSFSPENVSGTKAQVTELFAGATKQQQTEADAIRAEYNKAVSTGNWGLAGQLNDLLKEQEADVTRSKADFTAASKYFTGAGGAYELPTGFQTRREADYFKQQGLTGYTGLDIGSIGFTPETKADPFTQALSQQQKEFNTANAVYGELSKQFGATSDIAKNYFTSVVTPQKEQYEQISKMAGDVGKANLYGTITGAAGYKDFSPLKLAEIRNEAQTTAAFAPTIKTYETNVAKLQAARDQADRLGLGGYASQLNQLLDKENSRLEQARGARQSAIDQAQPDPMRDLILGKQMAAQKITGFTGVDLPDQDYSKLNAAQAFDPVIQRQNADYQAALGTYNQLKSLYGDKADVTKNFFSDVVTPQKQELDQANLIKANANSALGFINKGYPGYSTPNIAISTKTTEDGVRGVFKNALTGIDNSIRELETAISKYGDQTGVGYYSDALRRKIDEQNAKRDRINSDIDMYINKIPGRAKGSPPEGEMSNPVARMVAEQSRSKDQGMDSKSKAMLKKFAGGGEAVASSSPTSQEFPLNEKLYATGEARSLESTELPLIGKVARHMQTEERKSTARRNPREDITKADMIAESKEAMDWIADKLFGRTAIGKTVENIAQGMPTTRGQGTARYLTDTSKEALMGAAGLITPAGAKAAKEGVDIVARGAKKAGKKALKELGPVVAEKAMKYAPAAQPMYAVKPGGGTFFPEGSGSNLDTYLDKVVKELSATPAAANIPGKDAQAIADFIRKKGRKYFTSEYGTADDTLRTALLEGRMPVFGEDKKRFRGYMVKAARGKGTPVGAAQEGEDAAVAMQRSMGDPEAVMDLEKAYDSATGLGNYMFPKADATNVWDQQTAMVADTKRKLREAGVPPELQNVAFPTAIKESNRSLSSTPDAAKSIMQFQDEMDIAARRAQISEELGLPPYTAPTPELDKSLQYALKNNEPIYDVGSPSTDFLSPANVAKGIATIPLDELGRMTFAEAVIKGQKNTKFDRDWLEVVESASKGKTLPRKVYMEGTEPIYEINPNQQWVRVSTPDAVQLEGAAMNHSVGRYKTDVGYGKGGKEAFSSGATRVYSLRNEKGKPAITVESTWDKDNGLKITEIRAKFNSEPNEQEKQAIFELFDVLGPKDIYKLGSYTRTREGDILSSKDGTEVQWAKLYDDYLAYKNQ